MAATDTLLGVPVHGVTLNEAITRAQQSLRKKQRFIVHTANANVLVLAQSDKLLKKAFLSADLLLPDGQGAVLGSKLFGNKAIRTRVPGPDFFHALLERCNKQVTHTFFFLGSTQATLDKIKQHLKRYPNITYTGYSPPFADQFSAEQSNAMINAVNNAKPDVLWVGMTAPKQEKWVEEHKHKLNAPLIATVGAAFDYFAGTAKRAPHWLQRLLGNTEFLYRFLANPKRMYKRTTRSAITYPLLLLKNKLKR